MSATALRSLVRSARDGTSDDDLLAAVAAGDTVAFAEVVRRYGPLTLGACRRVCGPTADADDAFQLTFLALFRQAKSVRSAAALPGWLHRTAVRVAGKIKTRSKKPADVAEPAVSPDPAGELSWKEARAALDEEVNRLPESLRGPLVLCYLDGRTRDDAATVLGVSLSTLKRRLAEGLAKLNDRLKRRGIVGVGLATAVLAGGLTAAVPPTLAYRVLLVAAAIPLGGGLPALFTSWKLLLSAVVLAGGLATGAMLFAQPTDPVKAPPPKADPPKPGRDQLIDPLPEGALARLGTSRLRGSRLTFSPDSKRVVRETAAGDLQLFDVPSGKFLAKLRAKDVPGRESIIGSTVAFSPDSKLLAAVLWEGRAGIWDTGTGKLVRWIDADKFYSIVQCSFSPDGKRLAFGSCTDDRINDDHFSVGVYEVATGKKVLTAKGANSRFSDDGKRVFVWNGYSGGRAKELRVVPVANPDDTVVCNLDTQVPNSEDPRTDGKDLLFELTRSGDVLVRDWKTGETKHTLAGAVRDKERGGVNLRFAPGRRELIVSQANPPTLWCWNVDTGEQVWRREVPAPPYWAELSADGSVIVTPGKDGDVLTVDAKTGKDKAVIPAKSVGHSNYLPHISPDGKVVATETASPEPGGSTVLFWDAATGKLLTDLPGHTAVIRDAVFTADGSKILTAGQDGTLRTWDAATGRELSKVPLAAPTWMALSPDGKRLYAADAKAGKIRVVDPATGRVEATFAAFKAELVGMTLTADGQRLITAGRDAAEGAGTVRVVNAATGEQVREFDTGTSRLEQMAASADGSVIVTSHEGRKVVVWSVEGKELADHAGKGKREPAWKEKPPFYLIGSVAVSTDGRRVVFSDQEAGVGVIDAADGTLLGRAVLKDVYYQNGAARNDVRDVLVVSTDGKTVAWSGVESTADVYLIELRTQTVRRKLSGDSYPVKRLAFSPDGSKLLSTGPDGAALVWDVFVRTPRPFAEPDGKAVSGWWDALAAGDATTAEKAMRSMTAAPVEAVKLLTEKLTAPPVELGVIDQLISELGSPDFQAREAADRKLGDIPSALGKLERAAEKSESAEVRARAEKLVARLRTVGPLRAERAVEVLERIDTAEAKKLLETLAGAKDDKPLSDDARAALSRLKAAGR